MTSRSKSRSTSKAAERGRATSAIADLCEFLDASPTPHHVVATAAKRLLDAGFVWFDATSELPEFAGRVTRGFVTRGGALIAFVTSQESNNKFRIVGAHTDSPGLHLKSNPEGVAANFGTLEVEVYGSPTPIKALASVGAPEPNQIVVRPFDPGTLKDIEKAIQAADLGFNPQSDGRLIRITIPALSTDVRKKMSARIKELAEEARVAIRNVRRDANKAADTEKGDGTMTEDDVESAKEEVQELTKTYETKVGDLAKTKEAEVMEQ